MAEMERERGVRGTGPSSAEVGEERGFGVSAEGVCGGADDSDEEDAEGDGDRGESDDSSSAYSWG